MTNHAQVVAAYPDKVKIEIDNIGDFFRESNGLKIGSFLEISDNNNCSLIVTIENFSLESKENGDKKYLIEALPLGIINDGIFYRGGDTLSLPPAGVTPTTYDNIKLIFENSVEEQKKFIFSTLIHHHENISIPVDGNKFFNKHIAVVGSTGSGKSHTISSLLQCALNAKDNSNINLNNSHILIFDIHSEYKSAFPDANYLDITNLKLPYWLLNSAELEEILLDTGERDNYNQASIFRQLVTENKKYHNNDEEKIFYDSPLKFNINEILNALFNIKNETVHAKKPDHYMFDDSGEDGEELANQEKLQRYFSGRYTFKPQKNQSVSKGTYADGTLEKFFLRFETKVNDDRLKFLFDEENFNLTLQETLQNILGYTSKSNITILDLSGIPFEVLSITVSLISRLLFDYGYYHKKLLQNDPDRISNNDVPFLLVYEEAHKYAPKSDLVKYRSALQSIERIAKEGRKYGITLLLSTQRPSEISETIFSQCSNFISMRLTNPNDQNFITRLLPDTLGNMTSKLPSLQSGEALLLGEAIIMPLFVKINRCNPEPSSNDIPYFELWKKEWKEVDFNELSDIWNR